MARPDEGELEVSDELIKEILTAVRGLRYGSVEIVIHDGKVVQIERPVPDPAPWIRVKEKMRFDRAKSQKP